MKKPDIIGTNPQNNTTRLTNKTPKKIVTKTILTKEE